VTTHLFLPTFRAFGLRWRVRARACRAWGLWAVRDRFPEGTVYRVKAGPLIVVAMADRG
jgi:hypothetical protein